VDPKESRISRSSWHTNPHISRLSSVGNRAFRA